jgi:ribonuclease G
VALIEALKTALARDRTQAHISSISPLGLVEMTRKRTRESLEHLLCAACPQCQGRGYVRTPETVAQEIFRELLRQSRQFSSNELVVLAHPDVVGWLQDEEAAVLEQLEGEAQRPVRLQPEPQYAVDQYDVVLA